jgi:hypothetical protein
LLSYAFLIADKDTAAHGRIGVRIQCSTIPVSRHELMGRQRFAACDVRLGVECSSTRSLNSNPRLPFDRSSGIRAYSGNERRATTLQMGIISIKKA